VVAEKHGRRWVVCDVAPIAIHATRKRLLRHADVSPFVVQRVDGPGVVPERKLTARVEVDGSVATVALNSFAIPERAVPQVARASIAHWSQWIDGWCVDWDHRGGELRVGSQAWRSRGQARLPLSATHAYRSPGRYAAMIKAFDVLGGATTARLRVDVRR
jgi:hypothetical protein